MRKQSRLSSGAFYAVVLLVLVIMFATVILGGIPTFDPTTALQQISGATYTPAGIADDTGAQNNLQLKELKFNTVIPPTSVPLPQTPASNPPQSTNPQPKQSTSTAAPPKSTKNYCAEDTNQPMSGGCFCPEGNVTCVGGKATQVYEPPGLDHPAQSITKTGLGIPPAVASTCPGRQDGVYCEYKPVIYLYPIQDMLVNVSVQVAGVIVESIPRYPEGGWKNILAHPDGTLEYQNKMYRELFYEDSFTNMHAPGSGVIIPVSDLKSKLTLFTTRLGLRLSEQEEFLGFWLPRLRALRAPYILFSVFSPSQKEAMDKVAILPKPDTTIEFLAYFKPLQTPFAPVAPLILPNSPERKGFTAVIWGGTVDDN